MQYFTIQARSNRQAIERMKATWGEDARILTHRAVRLGGFLGLFSREGVEVTGYLSEDGGRRRRQEGIEEEKRKILEGARREQTLQQLLKEVQELRSSLAERPVAGAAREGHPTLARIDELLALNEFTPDFASALRERVREAFSLEGLENLPAVMGSLVEWIGERIVIDPPPVPGGGGPTVVALVGPTGVGKTTTVAKLAAVYSLGGEGRPARRVRIVTIDNYRIAARQQIETYAEIMGIPVTLVESVAELKKSLALAAECDLVLVDTIGRSPRDYGKLAEMQEILAAAQGERSRTYLAVSATTKASDLEEILRQFEPFGYRGIVLTKLDETNRLGAVISCLARRSKPLTWLCDGQGVPQDIAAAAVPRLLMTLEGFPIDREAVQARFGGTGAPAGGE